MPPSGVLTGLTKRIRAFDVQFAPASLRRTTGESNYESTRHRHRRQPRHRRRDRRALHRRRRPRRRAFASAAIAPAVRGKSFAVDVADSSGVNDAVKSAVAEFGPVDVAVVNAGITRDGIALAHVRRAVARGPLDQPRRRLLHRARGAGLNGARRARLAHLHRLDLVPLWAFPARPTTPPPRPDWSDWRAPWRREVASRSITVNVVAPGLIDTDMTSELGATGTPWPR